MKHTPSLVGISSSHSQGIPRFVSNPKIQYGVNKNTPLHPISTLLKSVPILTIYFFKKKFVTASRMWSGNLKERGHLVYVGADGKDNIKIDLKEIGRKGID
jgi:hypothetical protein